MTAKKNGNDGRPRTKAKRVVFRVQATKDKFWPWRSKGNGVTRVFLSKREAVSHASWECDYIYRNSGIRTQLVIHGKDGRIQSERTYGADPVRRRG